METTKTIDYGKALTWYINDKKFWPTTLTLSLYLLSCILVIPVFYVAPFLTGYTIKLIQNIQAGIYEIPEQEGNFWQEGVPLILLSIAVSVVLGIVVSIFVFGGTILAAVLANSSEVISGFFTIAVQLLSLMTQFIGSLIFPMVYFVAYAIYAKTKSVSSLFSIENYRTIWQQNTWGIVISYVIYVAVLSTLTGVGMLACCVGILPAAIAGNFIMAGYIGQFGVEGVV